MGVHHIELEIRLCSFFFMVPGGQVHVISYLVALFALNSMYYTQTNWTQLFIFHRTAIIVEGKLQTGLILILIAIQTSFIWYKDTKCCR